MPPDPDTDSLTPLDLARTQAFDIRPVGRQAVPDLLGGTRLGDFVLADRLGAGGMGAVYRATQVSRDRPAAVKVLFTAGRSAGFVARFKREVRLMGRLAHPHIVRSYAAGEAPGLVYLGMELLPGGSLGDRLARAGRLPVPEAVRVADELLAGLAFAHADGLVHRDVKPDNVLFDAAGRAKLGDLGLAKATDEDAGPTATQTGVGVGTPLYAPPEQVADAKRADARSDLYAVGGVLYHMLAGRPPFAAESLLDLFQAKARGGVMRPGATNPAVPPALDRLVLRLLAADPADRPATADDVRRELAGGRPGAPSP